MNIENPAQSVHLARLPVLCIQDVLIARFVARQQAQRLGFDGRSVVAISTAVSEITRNVIQHAQAPGFVEFAEIRADGRVALEIHVEDTGVGFSGAAGMLGGIGLPAGAGLPGSRKLVDEMTVQSRPGLTRVQMKKWVVTDRSGM
jgi:serine/threonine-protein kinase RsbT